MLVSQNKTDLQFPKHQRLTHKKRIAELFADGVSVKAFPFRLKFLTNSLAYHRILIGVPKRNIPLASNRNRIKRVMREIFRLNQHQLKANPNHFDILFIFTGKELPNFNLVEYKFLHLIEKIKEKGTQDKN